jgi:hypothetical protein
MLASVLDGGCGTQLARNSLLVSTLEQAKLRELAAKLATTNSFKAIAEEWLAKNERERRADQQLHALTGDGRYLFPSFRSGERPMSENTINAALRALGHGQRARLRRMDFECQRECQCQCRR